MIKYSYFADSVKEILEEKLKLKPSHQGNLILMNTVYIPITENDLKHKWYELWTNSKYVSKKNDCDKMAFAEMLRVRKRMSGVSPAAIGVVAGNFSNFNMAHALNFWLDIEGVVKLWDVQRQQVLEISPGDIVFWAII